LSTSTTDALLDWCQAYGHQKQKEPLFVALDFKHKEHRITGDGIYKLVRRYCQQAGIVRKVQKLSRHRQIDTLMIYDDNRAKDQVELSEILSGLTD
jgi:integrase/recombinase XerC